jgi:hypothetical protein
LARRYGAEIAYEMFAELFRRRLDGDDIKTTRALEQNFANPKSDVEQRIKADIDAYRSSQVAKWEKDLFAAIVGDTRMDTGASAQQFRMPSSRLRP